MKYRNWLISCMLLKHPKIWRNGQTGELLQSCYTIDYSQETKVVCWSGFCPFTMISNVFWLVCTINLCSTCMVCHCLILTLNWSRQTCLFDMEVSLLKWQKKHTRKWLIRCLICITSFPSSLHLFSCWYFCSRHTYVYFAKPTLTVTETTYATLKSWHSPLKFCRKK